MSGSPTWSFSNNSARSWDGLASIRIWPWKRNGSNDHDPPGTMISTLRKTVEAMGGTLSLVAEFPDRKPVVLAGIAGEPYQKPAGWSLSTAASARTE